MIDKYLNENSSPAMRQLIHAALISINIFS